MTHNGRQDKLDRIERMLQIHAEILNQLSPLLTQVAQIATSTVESVSRHDGYFLALQNNLFTMPLLFTNYSNVWSN